MYPVFFYLFFFFLHPYALWDTALPPPIRPGLFGFHQVSHGTGGLGSLRSLPASAWPEGVTIIIELSIQYFIQLFWANWEDIESSYMQM